MGTGWEVLFASLGAFNLLLAYVYLSPTAAAVQQRRRLRLSPERARTRVWGLAYAAIGGLLLAESVWRLSR